MPEADAADEMHELAEDVGAQRQALENAWQRAAQARILGLDLAERVVDDRGDLVRARGRLDVFPSSVLRHPEDVLRAVLVPVLEDLSEDLRVLDVVLAVGVAIALGKP